MIGINWLANLVGDLVCSDATTFSRDRLVYARALIGIKPASLLPSVLPVEPTLRKIAIVELNYE